MISNLLFLVVGFSSAYLYQWFVSRTDQSLHSILSSLWELSLRDAWLGDFQMPTGATLQHLYALLLLATGFLLLVLAPLCVVARTAARQRAAQPDVAPFVAKWSAGELLSRRGSF